MSLSARGGVAVAGMMLSSGVLAHGANGGGDFAALPWNWELWILICMALSIFGYARGLCRLDARARSRIFGALRCISFVAGIATLFFALISPFDALDDQLFSAHMAQHLLLMMVAAPLLVWSRPMMAFLWAFPLPARRAIGRFWTCSGLLGGVHALT
jgi:putative membrane protein